MSKRLHGPVTLQKINPPALTGDGLKEPLPGLVERYGDMDGTNAAETMFKVYWHGERHYFDCAGGQCIESPHGTMAGYKISDADLERIRFDGKGESKHTETKASDGAKLLGVTMADPGFPSSWREEQRGQGARSLARSATPGPPLVFRGEHPALSVPLTHKLDHDPGWQGAIEPIDQSWIAFIADNGDGLLWTEREPRGGAPVGVPFTFKRPDLAKSDPRAAADAIGVKEVGGSLGLGLGLKVDGKELEPIRKSNARRVVESYTAPADETHGGVKILAGTHVVMVMNDERPLPLMQAR